MGTKVLIVDDEPDLRRLIAKNLTSAGFEVAEAGGGQEALESFATLQPSVVVMDVMMPELDGFQTCLRLRALPGGEDVPIAFLTADGSDAKYSQALQSGVNEFLTKPIRREQLITRVSALAQWKALADDLRQDKTALQARVDTLRKIREHIGAPVAEILRRASDLELHEEKAVKDAGRTIRAQAELLDALVEGLVNYVKR